MNRIDTKLFSNGDDERDDNDDGGKHIHHAANNEQKNIEHHEENDFTADKCSHEVENFHGDLFVDEVVGESHRGAQNDQNSAHQQHAFSHNFGNIFEQL